MTKKITKLINSKRENFSYIKLFHRVFHSMFYYVKSLFNSFIAIIIFIILWEILSIVGVFDPFFISSPSTIITSIWYLIFHDSLLIDTFYTFVRVAIGIGFAFLISIPLGFLLGGYFKKLENSINPLLRLLEQLNPLTLFHLLILVTLINELSTVLVIYWAAQWPILNNTVSGAKNVNPTYMKIAKAAKLDKFDIFWKIQLRSALPNIFDGLRLGVIFGFLIAFGVEMMGMTTGNGLGYFIMKSQMNGQMSFIWAGIATMTLLSVLITTVINKIEKYFFKNNKMEII